MIVNSKICYSKVVKNSKNTHLSELKLKIYKTSTGFQVQWSTLDKQARVPVVHQTTYIYKGKYMQDNEQAVSQGLLTSDYFSRQEIVKI